MNILFTICGRAGSKGIKDKNLKQFSGYPLSYYTVSVIDLYRKQNPDIKCDIVLNTDSKPLIDLFQEQLKFDVDVILREASLALDNTPKIAAILNCLEIMEKRKYINYDLIVDLDITSPLRTSEDIALIVNKKTHSAMDVIFSVTESRRNPYFNMVKKTDAGFVRVLKSSFNSRQEAPEIFDMNASLYAFSPEFLKSGRMLFEVNCDVIKMMDTAVLDLDSEGDMELMQVIAKHLFAKYPLFRIVRDNIEEIYVK